MLKIIKVCEYAALFSHGFLPSYYETLFLFSPLKRDGEIWAALFNGVTLRNIIVIVNTIINSFCILREECFEEQTVRSGRLDCAGQTISLSLSLYQMLCYSVYVIGMCECLSWPCHLCRPAARGMTRHVLAWGVALPWGRYGDGASVQ